jgi:hypothetical protein
MGAGEPIDDEISDPGQGDDPTFDPPTEGARRRPRMVGLALGVVAVLAIGVGAAVAQGASGDEDAAPRPPRPTRTDGSAVPRTTSTTTATTTTATTTATTVAPATSPTTVPSTAPRSPAPTAAPGTRTTMFTPPPLPPPSPQPPATWVDTRPEASSPSSSCALDADGSIRATASVQWSDGFVDTATANYTTGGIHRLLTSRMWTFSFQVLAPPDGAIGDLACTPVGWGGPARWG